MLAKLTSKNQLTLPKSVTDSLGPVQYFEVQVQSGQVVLTPVRIQRGDAVRAKLAELELGDELFAEALAWAADAPAVKTSARTKATRVAKTKTAAKSVKASKAPGVDKANKTVKAAVSSARVARATKTTASSVKASAASKVAKPAARRRAA